MDSDTLNARQPPQDELHSFAGPSGLPMIEIANAHATARLSLHGAQVLSYRPRGMDADLLFLSEQALYQPGKAIRGGIPVCWPWFGPDPQGLGRPAHGLARTRVWALRRSGPQPGGETLVEMGLRDTAETRELWPHAFDLTLTVTIGSTLQLALTTRNTGEAPFSVSQALHSYFAVGDVAQTRVRGLDGCRYIDNAKGAGGAVKVQTGDVTVSGEVDRIYTGAPPALRIDDRARPRTVSLHSEGSRTAVVWNPWKDISAGMADLPDDAYRDFVCVETANAADDVVTLAPGAEHRLRLQVGVQAH